MVEEFECDRCGRRIAPHGHYIVRIDIFADPSMPPIDSAELEGTDFDKTFEQLLEQMRHRSADELQDDVHRHFDFHICRSCQQRFLHNPLDREDLRD